MTPPRPITALSAALALAMLIVPAGCSPYALRGRVIEGPAASVQIVADDDPRLAHGPGIPNASVQFTLDPTSLGRKSLGGTLCGQDGRFELPVKQFGAGFLEYELGILAQADKHIHAQAVVPMPPARRRILITLPPGRDRFRQPEDPLEPFRPYLQ